MTADNEISNNKYFPFSISTFLFPQEKNAHPKDFPEPVFEYLTVADGLPENSLWCILQDHLGYIWFGTQNGLVKYDGYNMKIYKPDPNDSLSISDRQIHTIYEDKSGAVWVGTTRGLNCFDRATETFTNFLHNPEDTNSTNSNYVTKMYEDNDGNLLVGTVVGLNLLERETKTFKHIYYSDSASSIWVRDIIKDSLTGNFYLAVDNTFKVNCHFLRRP